MLYRSDNELIHFIEMDGAPKSIVANENTTFSFRSRANNLEEALARYGRLLKMPLNMRDRMTNIRKDIARMFESHANQYVEEKLLSLLGNSGHPSRNFAWDNLKALREDMDDDTLYQRIEEFKCRHYSAHRMSLCLQTHFSLDEMQVRKNYFYSTTLFSENSTFATGTGCEALFVGSE